MNRREAIAALTSLPGVARIATAEPKPDDVIVVECDDYIPDSMTARIREHLSKVWPDRKIVVCPKDIRIKFAGR